MKREGISMSISKVSLSGLTKPELRVKRLKSVTLSNTFLTSVLMLSALDLIVSVIRNDSLSTYSMFVILNLVLTALGLVVASDLIVENDRESVKCFLAYMLFLWMCSTILKLLFM